MIGTLVGRSVCIFMGEGVGGSGFKSGGGVHPDEFVGREAAREIKERRSAIRSAAELLDVQCWVGAEDLGGWLRRW
jgi:hypothetical protein